MRQKTAQQAMKKNFILYKGHTGWKIKTRIFGTLLVSLSAVAIAESVSVVDAHAATTEGAPTADVSPSSTPKMSGSAVLPKTSSEPAQEDVSEEDVSGGSGSADTKTTTPEVESANINDTSADSTYQTLTPGQQVDVSKSGESADGTVHLSADQIKDHFKASVNDQDTSDNSGGSANTHSLSINDKGEVTLTSNDPHPYVNSDGSTTQQIGHQAAHVAFEHAIDFGHDFSMTGALGIGSNPKGADSVGIIFAKGDAAAALGGKSGRALGLGTLKNAFGFVYDNQHDSFDMDTYAVADPGTTDYFGWRTTDSSGKLQGDTSTGVKDTKELTGLNDRTINPFNNFTMTYDSKSKVLTVTLGGHDFTRTITDTTSGYSISIAASTGAKTNNYAVRIDSFTYTPKTANVDVNFTSQTTTPLSTATAAPVLANVGDTVSVFSSAEAAKRAVEADPTLNPDLITVLPTDSAGNVYVVDGSQAGSDTGTVHYINNDKDAADGAYYSYLVTGAADQKLAIPVSLTYKATITPVDQATGKAIPGIDPVVVNAVSGKSTVVQIPGFTPTTVTLPAPEDGQTTVAYNLPIDMSTTKTAATTTDGVANPIAHYYTASGKTVDGKPVKSSVVAVGTNQSITDALNGQLATDGKTAGVTTDDYYWSTVPNAGGTDSTDETNPQDSGSILLPTQSTLDSWTQKANDNQTKAEQVQKDAQSIYDTFVAKDGLSQDQKDAAKKLLDSVNNFAQQVSDANAQAKASFTAAEAATDPATIFSDSQDGYKAISGMSDSMDSLASFETDLDNMKTTTEGSLATFVSVTAPYGTETLPFPDVTFGKDFGADVTAEQKQGFDNPDFYYYVSSADLTTPVTPTDAGLYYFKLTDKGRTYLKSLTTNTNAGLYVSSTLTITPAEVTPTITATSVVYGGDNGKLPEITGSFGSQLANDENPVTQSDFEITDAAGNPIDLDKLQANGDYTIRYTAAAQTRLAGNKNFDFGDKLANTTAKLTVTKRPITVVAQNTGKTYGVKTDPKLTLTDTATDGLVNGDSLSALVVNLTRAPGEDAGSYDISGTGTSDNYEVTVNPGAFTISAAKVTPTIKDMSVVYGGVDGNLPEITWSLGSDQVNADHPVSQADFEIVDNGTGKTVAVNQLQAGGDYTIQLTSTAKAQLAQKNGNYDFTDFGTGTLTVAKRPVTIQVANQEINAGAANPQNTATLTNGTFKDGETVADLKLTYGEPTNPVVGTYAITADSGNPNYEVTVDPGQLKVLGKDVDEATGTVTITEKDSADNVVKIDKQWKDGSETIYTYDPTTEERNVSEQKNGKEVDSQSISPESAKVTLSDGTGENTSTVVVLDPETNQPTFEHDTTQTATVDGTTTTTTTDEKGNVVKVVKQWPDGHETTYTYDPMDGKQEVVEQKDGQTVDQKTIGDQATQATLTSGDDSETVQTTVNVVKPGAAPTFEHDTTQKTTVDGTTTTTTTDEKGNVVKVVKQWPDGHETTYTYDPIEGTQAVVEQKNGQTVAQKIIDAQATQATLTSGDDSETVQTMVNVVNPGAAPTFEHDTTQTTHEKSGDISTTKDAKGTVIKVTKQWADGDTTTYTYDPVKQTGTVTEQKDGKQVDQQTITADALKVTLSNHAGGETVFDAGQLGTAPTLAHYTTEKTDDGAGNVTATTKDTDGNVVKVVQQWADGDTTTYTYDPVKQTGSVTEQKGGQQLDQQPIDTDSTTTLSAGADVKTIVKTGQPGTAPTFKHETTQKTTDKYGTVTETTKDAKGNVIKVTKQWVDGDSTIYTYDPATGKQVVTEQKGDQTIDQQPIGGKTTQATLTNNESSDKTIQTIVSAPKPGEAPTFEHNTTLVTPEKSGDIATTKDDKGNIIRVTKQWPDGGITTYTYNPVTGARTVTEEKNGKQVDQQVLDLDDPDTSEVTLSDGAGGKVTVKLSQADAMPTFAHYPAVPSVATDVSTDDAQKVVKVTKKWNDGLKVIYTYDPATGERSIREFRDGALIEHRIIEPETSLAVLPDGKGGSTIVKFGESGATVSFTRQLADKAGSRKMSSRKNADSAKRKKTSKRTTAVKPLSGSTRGQGDMKLAATNEGNAGDMTVTGPESQQQSGQQQTQLPQTGQKNENFLVQLGAILLGLLSIPFIRRRSH